MHIKIIYNTEEVDWNAVSYLLTVTDIGSPDADSCEKAFGGSWAKVFAYHDDILVGCARAISDGVKEAAVYDVAVLPPYQGHGIGKRMMEVLMDLLKGQSILLFANIGKEVFYRKLGFSGMKTGMAKFVHEERMREKGFID
ncbi:GNAT family N-acetyltransferase [Alkalibacter rhizosphaerae]|uniref:GNAT family N-acetyltransferase n=1 Tax=Alkalibacter rhizosphaerae TaxID=2815577 RepID=A0A974XF78_9FIRM|nr:GNAT family N-acetyltransferase [Alkalibacter rhizosphaerae]QSX08601.1 GNAT family N-acetyltransferase [Alkalibacter rhizosphaerae]